MEERGQGEHGEAPAGATLDIPLLTLRALFLASAMGLGLYIADGFDLTEHGFVAMLVGGALAMLVVSADALAVARSSIGTVSAVVFGLLIGFLAAQLFLGIVALVVDFEGPEGRRALGAIRLALTLIFCYLGPAYLLRTKDDFRFIVPYVEFQKQVRGPRPLVLDTSAIIDGRVVDLARAHVFDAPFVVPRPVVEELQRIADSPDKNRRGRGRRGLERLKALQDLRGVEVRLLPGRPSAGEEVDRHLIEVARARAGRLVTVDWNLHKVCDLEGIPVVNLNEVAEAMRAPLLPGEQISLRIVKHGEGPQQGVGYLADGTMVVVEGARKKKGETVAAWVTSALQSSAGRMVFARLSGDDEPALAGDGGGAGAAPPGDGGGAGAGGAGSVSVGATGQGASQA